MALIIHEEVPYANEEMYSISKHLSVYLGAITSASLIFNQHIYLISVLTVYFVIISTTFYRKYYIISEATKRDVCIFELYRSSWLIFNEYINSFSLGAVVYTLLLSAKYNNKNIFYYFAVVLIAFCFSWLAIKYIARKERKSVGCDEG